MIQILVRLTNTIYQIMKNIILIIFAVISLTNSYSQMNKKTFYEIEYSVLTGKEKKAILTNQDVSNVKKEKGDNIFTLNDGRIVYEMVDVKTYLFKNIIDFNYFEKKSVELANESVGRKTAIKDLTFINKIPFYIELFKQRYSLDFDPNDLNSLKKVDNVLNSIERQNILKFRRSIIAIIGESIVLKTEDGKWKNFQINKNTNIPAIFAKGSVIDPVAIFDYEFYEKYEEGKKISLYNSIKKQVESL